ncbi:hypothetical protein PSV08DRAFT_378351 [Bipolaris maydis]|nr:hypothetical protein PSV08DRAFT_378351 [Bipolaris maydis]
MSWSSRLSSWLLAASNSTCDNTGSGTVSNELGELRDEKANRSMLDHVSLGGGGWADVGGGCPNRSSVFYEGTGVVCLEDAEYRNFSGGRKGAQAAPGNGAGGKALKQHLGGRGKGAQAAPGSEAGKGAQAAPGSEAGKGAQAAPGSEARERRSGSTWRLGKATLCSSLWSSTCRSITKGRGKGAQAAPGSEAGKGAQAAPRNGAGERRSGSTWRLGKATLCSSLWSSTCRSITKGRGKGAQAAPGSEAGKGAQAAPGNGAGERRSGSTWRLGKATLCSSLWSSTCRSITKGRGKGAQAAPGSEAGKALRQHLGMGQGKGAQAAPGSEAGKGAQAAPGNGAGERRSGSTWE